MALKAEGIWPCTVLSGDYGENPERAGIARARINVTIDDGPSKGQFCTYEDEVTNRSALYIGRSCRSVGWKGGPDGDDLKTLAADIEAWIKETGGKALVEIKHIPIKNGKRAGEIWDKVQAIRRRAAPLKAASGEVDADAREAMRAALRDDGVELPATRQSGNGYSAPPQDDYVPPVADEDIPF